MGDAMTTFWEHLEDGDKEKLLKEFPSLKPPTKKQLNVKVEGKITGNIDKEMRKVPRDTRRH